MSIGRYVLAGGELAAMVLCDAILRKLPGALGDERSAVEESFSAALEGGPEYPHYTRPAEHRGWRVPEVLLSGHHARIAEWRLAQSRARPGAAEAPDAATPDLVNHQHRLAQGLATIGRRMGSSRLRARPLAWSCPRRAETSRFAGFISHEHSHSKPGAITAPPGTGV